MSRQDTIGKHATTVAFDKHDNSTTVTYHTTPVVKVSGANCVRLDSGGWQTVTTKTRMNQAANELGLGYTVYQKDFGWFVELRDGTTLDFFDGMTFYV